MMEKKKETAPSSRVKEIPIYDYMSIFRVEFTLERVPTPAVSCRVVATLFSCIDGSERKGCIVQAGEN